MSDPMNRPLDPPPPPPEAQSSRRGSPLLWLLLLAALIAVGWYFYNRRSLETNLPAPLPPAAETADSVDVPGDDTATTPRPEPAAPSTRAPARPALPDREAEPIARLQPTYPPEAFRAGEEGIVLVRAEIDASGMPSQVEVANGSGSRELDRAAVEAVRKWRFEPAVRNGKRVASTVQVPVDFKLDRQ